MILGTCNPFWFSYVGDCSQSISDKLVYTRAAKSERLASVVNMTVREVIYNVSFSQLILKNWKMGQFQNHFLKEKWGISKISNIWKWGTKKSTWSILKQKRNRNWSSTLGHFKNAYATCEKYIFRMIFGAFHKTPQSLKLTEVELYMTIPEHIWNSMKT